MTRWLRRLGRTLFGTTESRDLLEELRLHEDLEVDDLIRQGVSPDAARRQARLRLGGATQTREESRATRGLPWIPTVLQDSRFAVRSLRRSPGLTFVVILTMALGVGANATFFTIVNALILKPLPVREPAALVALGGDTGPGEWTYPIWEQIASRSTLFSSAAFAWAPTTFNLADTGESKPVDGAYVSGSLFQTLGVTARRGRMVGPDDDRRDGGADGPVAVISHRFWMAHFGGRDVVGERLVIARVPVTVVGIAPPSFFGLEVGRHFDVMIPFAVAPLISGDRLVLEHRSAWWLHIGARLQPDQAVEQAQAALRGIQPAIREATIPVRMSSDGVARYLTDPFSLVGLERGHSPLRSQYGRALATIMAVVGLVLVIACANVANLLIARATTRAREMSVRSALGASRMRLMSQPLIEAALLSTCGGVIGILLARFAGSLLVTQLSTWRSAVTLDLAPDWRLMVFLSGVITATALVSGVAPAWVTRRASPQDALRRSGRGMTGDRGALRNILVVVQVALSLVLLMASGLFLRTFIALDRSPLGMAAESLVAVEFSRASPTTDETPAARAARVEQLSASLRALPGVVAVSGTTITPLSGGGWNTSIDDESLAPPDRRSWLNGVTPGWFTTVGATVTEGRDFTTADAEGVAIANEAFVARFLSRNGAVGQTVVMTGPGGGRTGVQIIGVSSNVIYRSPREGMRPTLFLPLAAAETSALLIRTAPGQSDLTPLISRTIAGTDPALRFTLRPLRLFADATTNRERLTASLGGAFGLLALLLSSVGLYGVISYTVTRRRSEIAVRMALGADRGTVAGLVLRSAGVLVGIGVIIGAFASWWAAQLLETLLFGVDKHDPITMIGTAVLLGGVGLVAAWLPARRASRIEPASLLRESQT